MKHVIIGVLLSLGVAACGGSSSTVTPTPTYVNAAGLWTGSQTLTSVADGECAGDAYRALQLNHSIAFTLQIAQNVSALTAVATATATGVATNYTGTAATSSFTLNVTPSTAVTIPGFGCSDGQLRDLQLTAGTIVANVANNSATGTFTFTYNVFLAGTQTSVGVMQLGGTTTMTR